MLISSVSVITAVTSRCRSCNGPTGLLANRCHFLVRLCFFPLWEKRISDQPPARSVQQFSFFHSRSLPTRANLERTADTFKNASRLRPLIAAAWAFNIGGFPRIKPRSTCRLALPSKAACDLLLALVAVWIAMSRRDLDQAARENASRAKGRVEHTRTKRGSRSEPPFGRSAQVSAIVLQLRRSKSTV